MFLKKAVETEISCRIARTREEEQQLQALDGMFGQLHHSLYQWVATFCEDGDITKASAQDEAMLDLFNAVRLLFEGHTRHSAQLRLILDAFGQLYGFDIQPHMSIDAEDAGWLKAHGIAPADEGRL